MSNLHNDPKTKYLFKFETMKMFRKCVKDARYKQIKNLWQGWKTLLPIRHM